MRRELTLARHVERQTLAGYRKAQESGDRKAIRSARQAWQDARAGGEDASARIQRTAKAAATVALCVPDSLDQIQGYVRPGEALVFFGLTTEEAFALVMTPDGARQVVLPPSIRIKTAVDALLDGDRSVDPERVAALRGLLVEPLEIGEDVKRVLVCPEGRLGYVPFSILLPGREVVCMPSGTTLGLLLKDREKRGVGVLALGDPDYGSVAGKGSPRGRRDGRGPRLSPLPATREEVRAIADVAVLGKKATETGLQDVIGQRDRWRAVHFACHGLVNPAQPLFSSLAMTADDENDGFLTALEVFRMKIPADLVVLSACNTGKGKIYRTEGIVGLTRAFMFAGAPRVICSLWKVDDEATKVLMVKFYELWNPKKGKGLPAATALRQAQAAVRSHKRWEHPCYWAAWVLWGLPD